MTTSRKPGTWVCGVLLVACAVLWYGAPAALPQGIQPSKDEGPITITSLQLELDHEAKEVLFKGNVKAVQGDTVILCREMLVLYQQSTDETGGDKEKIKEIHADGDVLITQGDRGVRGEKAVYYHDDRKVVITGNPSFTQGPQNVEGARITLFLDGKRFLVEGDPDKPVKAVLYPGGAG